MALSPKTQKIVRGVVDYGGVAAFLVGYLVHRDLVLEKIARREGGAA